MSYFFIHKLFGTFLSSGGMQQQEEGSCLLDNGVIMANGDTRAAELTCGVQGRIACVSGVTYDGE